MYFHEQTKALLQLCEQIRIELTQKQVEALIPPATGCFSGVRNHIRAVRASLDVTMYGILTDLRGYLRCLNPDITYATENEIRQQIYVLEELCTCLRLIPEYYSEYQAICIGLETWCRTEQKKLKSRREDRNAPPPNENVAAAVVVAVPAVAAAAVVAVAAVAANANANDAEDPTEVSPS